MNGAAFQMIAVPTDVIWFTLAISGGCGATYTASQNAHAATLAADLDGLIVTVLELFGDRIARDRQFLTGSFVILWRARHH